jgi:hypothetical protein
VVDERLRPDAKPRKDMLASFLSHGLTPSEAEAEISISLYVLTNLLARLHLFTKEC